MAWFKLLDGSATAFYRTSIHFTNLHTYKLTKKKPEALCIASCKNSNLVLPSNKPISWAKRKVYAMGVWFSILRDYDDDRRLLSTNQQNLLNTIPILLGL